MNDQDELKAKTIVDSWYWQMSEGHNFRWKNAVKSMTLFYESAPLESDVAQLVLEYLRTRASVTELVVGHKKWTFDAPGWNAKDAWYQTAPGEQWAGTESKKVRVYWVLAQAGDGTADGPYTVENGCKYLVTHSYYWDVASEPTLPQSTSGVQYTIQGFTRDRETGLYTYIVEKRETVQQDIPLYESVKTIFEDVSEEQHLGVKQNNVAATGLQASVGNGERIERHLSKNADCTTDIVNRKHKDKKVEEARTVVRKELRGTSDAKTDRNLTPAEVAAKTAAAQEVGETRTIEKTDTDYRNLTVEKFTPGQLPMTIAESCEKETSVHTHTKVEAVTPPAQDGTVEQTAEPNKRKTVLIKKNDDGKTADKTTTTQTWEEKTGGGSTNSGNGVVTTTTERKENTTSTPTAAPGVNKVVEIEETPNDHGSKTTFKRVTEYHEKTGGGSSDSGGGVVTTTTERKENTTSTPTAVPGVNKVVEIEETPNDHGSKTTFKRVTEHATQTAGGSSQSGPNAGGSVVTPSKTTTTRKLNATTQETAENGDAGVNKTVEIDNQPNGMGGFNTVKRVTEHATQTADGGGFSGTVSSTETERTVNATTEATVGTAAANKVVEVDNQPNGMGGFNAVKRTTNYYATSKTKTWSDDLFDYEECAYSNQLEPIVPITGEIKSLSFHPNGHGSYDGSYTVRTSKTAQGSTLQWSTGPTNVTAKYHYFNKQGHLCSRMISGQVYRCGGKLPHVASEIQTKQNSGYTGFAPCGWNTGVSGSYEHAMGVAYQVTSVGSELDEDGGSGSGSGGS